MNDSLQIKNTVLSLINVLGANLKAIYLIGSSVLEGLRFDSDLDFLVFINDNMINEVKREIVKQMGSLSKKNRK